MGPDQQRLTPDERSNLVAFIDGELGEAETQAISTKLAHSVTARRELDALKRSWELLDHLTKPVASEALATRTLTSARGLVSKDERIIEGATAIVRRALKIVAFAGVLVVSFAVGLILTRWAWPNPTDRLARRLSIAEHVDEYEAIGSFEFLELLEKSPNF